MPTACWRARWSRSSTRALNRTLTLLGLIQGPDDVAIVRHALRLDDARLRSRAIEYLDNLLEGDRGSA